MLMASMIHVVLSDKHSAGGESFSRKVESSALLVLCGESSFVAKDHGMGLSDCVKIFFMSSCWVRTTTATMVKMFLSAFRMICS